MSEYRKEKEIIVKRLNESILPDLMDGYNRGDTTANLIFEDEGYILDGGDYADSLIMKWREKHPSWLEYLIVHEFNLMVTAND